MTTNFADKTVWTGDNLDILRGLNSDCVDLIYLDPPFNSNRNYAAPVGSAAAGAAFKDTWTLSDLDVAWMGLIADEQPAMYQVLQTAGLTHGKGMQSYLCMMAVRLLEMRRVLKDTGSIYLHCDPTASHYLKLLMDSIFGQGNFRNEVIWSYRRWPSQSSRFQTMHDVILMFAKGEKPTFNIDYEPPSASYLRRFKGRTQVLDPETGTRKLVVDRPTKGMPQRDVWDISIIAGSSKERIGYPTQKPLALLERIIKASSDEGDVVLDPFCGCATACVAAENLGRRWVGIDISPKAVELVNMRLQQTMGELFHNRLVTARKDIPRRTDIDAPIPYRQNKHVLFGQQEGRCNGCRSAFEFRHLEVDHIIPRSHGGADHLENLQLLCAHCNRVKGDRPQEYLVARLREMGMAA
ncbi:MAG: hypothetical protein F4X64_18905 [Chloroflexi bacterium]|nr:hypothetical protein [Chloroflexota bacterium]